MQRRPQRVVMTFEGVRYEMDRYVLQLALVRRQVEGEFHQKNQLAQAAGCSRSTLSRFLSGRKISLRVVMAILEKLHLTFDEVFRRCDDLGPPER
jgi:transcriptional regulator with XRE-family HTH domain